MKNIHLGSLIAKRLKEIGMPKAEFGRRLNTSRQNVGSLLKRESFDTAFLATIGEVLEYDFFKYLVSEEDKLESPPQEPAKPVIKLLIEMPLEKQSEVLSLVLGSEDFASKFGLQ